MAEYVELITRRSGNQSPRVFPKDLGKDIAREDVEDGDVEEDIDQENENTCSLVSEVTKWEKMRQAGQKLSESALTPETLKSYEKLRGHDSVKDLSKDTPAHIVCWIMETCESESSDSLPEAKGRTWSHALKMWSAIRTRAAITFTLWERRSQTPDRHGHHTAGGESQLGPPRQYYLALSLPGDLNIDHAYLATLCEEDGQEGMELIIRLSCSGCARL
ncbi:hypothetical protein V8E54_012101 [Elaphomyces granulatus]